MNQLFGTPYDRSSSEWVVHNYFDWIYDSGYFVEMVSHVAKKWGFTTDDVGCRFPDMDSYFEEDHFEGVELIAAMGAPDPDEVIVSEEVFWGYLRDACSKYVDRHPEDRDVMVRLLDNIPGSSGD